MSNHTGPVQVVTFQGHRDRFVTTFISEDEERRITAVYEADGYKVVKRREYQMVNGTLVRPEETKWSAVMA